jgi:hypothetical protein
MQVAESLGLSHYLVITEGALRILNVITKLFQANSSIMIGKILDCFKRDFAKMSTGAIAPHQGVQGGHPLI